LPAGYSFETAVAPTSERFGCLTGSGRWKTIEDTVMKKLLLALLITLLTVSAAAADTVYLRGGTALSGTVLGYINGRFAIRLTTGATLPVTANNRNPGATVATRTVNAGEVVFLRPREIERIEIDGRSLDEARYQTRTVDVSLSANWIDTGVDLRRGERVKVDATGTIYANRSRITPAGLNTTDPNAPLPRAPEGALIGVVGNDNDATVVEIGAGSEFVADRDGRLYLTVNRGNYTDARGTYNVRIRKELDLTAMARTADDRNDGAYDPFGVTADSGAGQTRSRVPGGGVRNPNRDNRRNRILERVVEVPGNAARGADTGIDLQMGDQVTISATGNVTAGRRAGVVSPDGGRVGAGAVFGASTYPLPTSGVGALIGIFLQSNGQQSQPFLIGSQQTFTAPMDGRLILLVNDDNYTDNSGSFSARIVYPDNR